MQDADLRRVIEKELADRGIPKSRWQLMKSPRRIWLLDTNGRDRFVYLDGRSHPTGGPRTNEGHSIGWWEDDVLVVDVDRLEGAELVDDPPQRGQLVEDGTSRLPEQVRRFGIRQCRLGQRIHGVGGGVEVEAVALMDRLVAHHQRLEPGAVLGGYDFINIIDGSGGQYLRMPAGGSRMPASAETVEYGTVAPRTISPVAR